MSNRTNAKGVQSSLANILYFLGPIIRLREIMVGQARTRGSASRDCSFDQPNRCLHQILMVRSAPQRIRNFLFEDVPVPKSISFTSRSVLVPSSKRVKTMFSGLISMVKSAVLILSVFVDQLPSMHYAFCIDKLKSLEKLACEDFDLIS